MAKIKFRTQFDRISVKSNPGSRFVITYKPKYTDTGALDLVEDGKIDVYDQIQSFRDSTDINVILKRFENGDVNALNQKLPYFADISEMPTTLAGFLQLHADAENAFSRLPAEIRQKFNNSSDEFFAAFGTDYFNDVMGIKSADEVVKEVDDSVSKPE